MFWFSPRTSVWARWTVRTGAAWVPGLASSPVGERKTLPGVALCLQDAGDRDREADDGDGDEAETFSRDPTYGRRKHVYAPF